MVEADAEACRHQAREQDWMGGSIFEKKIQRRWLRQQPSIAHFPDRKRCKQRRFVRCAEVLAVNLRYTHANLLVQSLRRARETVQRLSLLTEMVLLGDVFELSQQHLAEMKERRWMQCDCRHLWQLGPKQMGTGDEQATHMLQLLTVAVLDRRSYRIQAIQRSQSSRPQQRRY